MPFPVRCPLSWHTPDPAPAHRDPNTTLLLPGLEPNQVQTPESIEPGWFRAQCAAHVCHTCTQAGLWEKGQEQAPLDLPEIHLAFDFLAGSNFG